MRQNMIALHVAFAFVFIVMLVVGCGGDERVAEHAVEIHSNPLVVGSLKRVDEEAVAMAPMAPSVGLLSVPRQCREFFHANTP